MAVTTNHRFHPAPVTDLDWSPEQARDLGRKIVDLWSTMLERVDTLPAGRHESQDEVRRAMALDVPEAPLPLDELLAHLRAMALDHSVGPGHPAFLGYVSSPGTIPGAAADLLAAGMNQNLGAWLLSPAASEIELQLIRWLASLLGMPAGTGGLITTGGSMANLIALKVARDHRAGWNVRADGMRGGPPMTVYVSAEAHWSIDRSADELGIGLDNVRHVPVSDDLRMVVPELRRLVAADRNAGNLPFAVVGTAGTTSTGAVDPLEEIADTCAVEQLWFHVDGAYGAAASLSPRLRPLLAGIERADSVTLDPHKWLYTPVGAGCVLVREDRLLPASFAAQGSYLYEDKDQSGRGDDFGNCGPQFSRSFAALKVWMSLLAHGRLAYERRIEHDVELAHHLHARVSERRDLQPVGTVTLSVACFRYVPEGLPSQPESEEYLDLLNQRLLMELQLDGRVFCSNAVVHDRFTLRACITNFRTESVHIDRLLDVASELGARLDDSLRPDALR